jgi:hypothetical protein
MIAALRRLFSPAVATAALAGLLVGGLLLGFEPVGGDPDRMYRPLKQELARSLASGRFPYWADHFGLGMPLVAESHVASFYPLNWLLYAGGHVTLAYRISMWLHYVFLACTTYAYARFLKISKWGAAIAAISFTYCGFQAIHSSHEPFYHALPFMPLAVLLGERYLGSGRFPELLGLALAWAAQLTLGHFQLQTWTAALVLLIGFWRVAEGCAPWRRLPGLALALLLGAVMAAVQLVPSWELARFVGSTNRAFSELAFFAFPPAHWAELAIPGFLRGIPGGPEAAYWYASGTSGYEACFYVGTIPLILAFLGLFGGPGRPLAPWGFIAAAAATLAMLPIAWPAAYALLLQVPGLGWFRAPGRYVAISSLGLALLAGHGLDRAGAERSVRLGLALAWTFALAAAAWVFYWTLRGDHRSVLGDDLRLATCLGSAGLAWGLGTTLILAWRAGRIGAWVVLLATAGELGCLYYTSTTEWGWAIELPGQSRILSRLAEEPGVGRVAGLVHDLPIRAGLAPAFPYTGFAPPPPHPFLEIATRREEASTSRGVSRLRRYGVTHGIWDGPVERQGVVTVMQSSDPALDRVAYKPPGAPARADWRIVRYAEPFPQVRPATLVRLAPNERSLVSGISFDTDPKAVWYGPDDNPGPLPEPRAASATVLSWDGATAEVEHDGSCDLVVNRTYYPGWSASIDGGPDRPVARAEIGVQAVRLTGRGRNRVTFLYRPNGLATALPVSFAALALAGLGTIGTALIPWFRRPVKSTVQPAALLAVLVVISPSASGREIPAPEAHFGFAPGTDGRLAGWTSVVSYFEAVDRASDRVAVSRLGPTTEGRPYIMAVVSSPETVRELDRHRGRQRKLADPRHIEGLEEERRLLETSKPVILITCSIHSNEPASTLMAVELLHGLAARTDQATREILDGTIVLLVPSANPDGVDKVKSWYDRSRGKPWEGSGMPELFHRYAGRDTNRDWFMLNLCETRILARVLYRDWFPTILLDVHQMGPKGARIFVPPFYDPVNPNIDPRITASIARIGAHMASALAGEGKHGVLTSAIYDNWWNGGNRTTPERHNIVSVLTETASVNTASPIFLSREQLTAGEKGFHDHRPAANFADPWPGGWWRLRDIIDYELTSARSLLTLAARYRREFQADLLAMARAAIERGRAEPPRAWIVPADQHDPAAAAAMIDVLRQSGVEVRRAREEFLADGATYPAGSWVLPADQPYRAHLKDMMERQVYPARFDPRGLPEMPYDVTGWTLPLLMGVKSVEVAQPIQVRAGAPDRVECAPEAAGRGPALTGLAGLRQRRIAVYQPWIPSADEGWTRFVLERFEIPYKTIHNAEVRAGSLRKRFDVLVLPSILPAELRDGFHAGQTEPEYVGGLGTEGAIALCEFVTAGGILVCLEDSCLYTIEELKLPVRNVLQGLGASQFFGPGSVVELSVNGDVPLGAGMPRVCWAAFDRSLAFEILPAQPGSNDATTVAARYAAAGPLASGWMLGAEKIQGKAALVEVGRGQGRVILFAFPPQNRGQSRGTSRLLFNALASGRAPSGPGGPG